MPRNHTLPIAALLCFVASFDTTATAQDVVLSEVAVVGGNAWIEVHNRGAAPADLTGWSLYLATATPHQPGNYWWGFYPGTTLAPGGYLLVHWFEPVPQTQVPGEFSTGDSMPYFLFGWGGEPLPLDRGAVALLSSQRWSEVNTPLPFVDWVGWGSGGLIGESLAVQAGAWTAGRSTPSLLPDTSLARHPSVSVTGEPQMSWFLDTTPTPNADNVGAAALAQLGTACAPTGHHLLGSPGVVAAALPILGNAGFGFDVTNTTGAFLEHCIVVLATDAVPAGIPGLLPPTPGDGNCRVFVDPGTVFASYWLPTTITRTRLPLSLENLPPSLAGQSFTVQALVFDLWATAWPPYQGLSAGLVVTLGG